ncbi:hypothetical protein [Chryseobacterium daeguense]|uniref:hypothetical protein n=1 Tax=Chryseobacterium daeguense TaxID=412438 RepID=UPI000486996B|nr:hypothetical protein [Chryseobacterium daeguense]
MQIVQKKDVYQYFSFLKEHNLGFPTTNIDFFPDIDLSFNDCFPISNAVIDYFDEKKYNIYNLLKQLDDLNCKNIEIRFYNNDISSAVSVLDYIDNNKMIISTIGIVIENNKAISQQYISKLIEKYNRVSYFIIHNSG